MDAAELANFALLHHPWRARMTVTTGQTAQAVNAFKQIAFDTIDYDPNGNLTTGASAKYTAPVTGYYRIAVHVSANPGGVSSMTSILGSIFKNGAEYSRIYRVTNTALGPYEAAGSDIILLAAGDTVDFRVEVAATSGTWAVENNAGGNNAFAICFDGPA